MKKLFTIGVIVLLGHIAGVSHAQAGENVNQAWVTQNLTSMPLAFTQNMGQWDERALFRADAGGATMWITTEGVYYQFTRRVPRDNNPPQAVGHPDHHRRQPKRPLTALSPRANLQPEWYTLFSGFYTRRFSEC